MLTLWALLITLAVRAAAVDPLSLPSVLPNSPVGRPILQSGQVLRYPSVAGSSSFRQRLPVTPPVANDFMTSSKLEDCKSDLFYTFNFHTPHTFFSFPRLKANYSF